MSFAAVEARLNASIMRNLANAVAVIGQRDVPVIFDSEYTVGSVGVARMGAAEPQMVLATSDVPADFVDSTVLVDGVAWRVRERQPDSQLATGLTLVILEQP